MAYGFVNVLYRLGNVLLYLVNLLSNLLFVNLCDTL